MTEAILGLLNDTLTVSEVLAPETQFQRADVDADAAFATPYAGKNELPQACGDAADVTARGSGALREPLVSAWRAASYDAALGLLWF
jgi:hypothetical protein